MTALTTLAALAALAAFTIIVTVWKALADIGHVSRPLGSPIYLRLISGEAPIFDHDT